ncbi:MAG TPA: phosphopantetheine-binding protein [Dongiaceae bacterium]|nr:phosphopantetheine-binding protein [Dongiaceae bacterium]
MNDALTDQVLAALHKVKPGLKDAITPESTLESLRLDSLDTITLLFELEDRVGIEVPDADARDVRTVGEIIERIRRLKDVATAES